jgi:endonuclease YncB( thermonuclease family)
MFFRRLVYLAAVLAIGPSAAEAAPRGRETLPGPVSAVVDAVLDGDTVRVRALIWLGQELTTGVRLRGIDAPELRGRCAAEREKARQARLYLQARVEGRRVWLSDIAEDKYGGRVVARLATRDGVDVGRSMLERGLVRPYAPRGPRDNWCNP